MNPAQSRLSLRELRRKTDRELVILAGREIERSLKLVSRGAIADAEATYRSESGPIAIIFAGATTKNRSGAGHSGWQGNRAFLETRQPGRHRGCGSHVPPSQGSDANRPRARSAAVGDGSAPGPDTSGHRSPAVRRERLCAIGVLLKT